MWLPIHVRRDNKTFLHLVERPIADHLAEEFNNLEETKEIIATLVISNSEDHVLVLVKVKEKI